MTKCDCYKETEEFCCRPFGFKKVGICNGTKERDRCYCEGYETKCDFYPEVRERAFQKNDYINNSPSLFYQHLWVWQE